MCNIYTYKQAALLNGGKKLYIFLVIVSLRWEGYCFGDLSVFLSALQQF